MGMQTTLDQTHQPLFSGTSLKLGIIHWYLLKAQTEIDRRRSDDASGQTGFNKPELTEFGKELGKDEIHWWIFKKEESHAELQKKTEEALVYAQKLKESATELKASFSLTYDRLVGKLKDFSESHAEEIMGLYEYVTWLHSKDILSPGILYTYRVWGSTRLSNRWAKVTADSPYAQDANTVKRIVELVFGLRSRCSYRIDSVRQKIEYEIFESLDPEDPTYSNPITVPLDHLFMRTSWETLDSIAEYFEMIRDSLRNVLLDIQKYSEQRQLMKSDTFWKNFVMKAKDFKITEQQLWDFKKTLDMWHIRKGEDKDKAELKFTELVAGFANTDGGVIVVGVSDKLPREIVGIGNDSKTIENYSKYTGEVIKEYVDYSREVVYLHTVGVKDVDGNEKTCLMIAIARSCEVVPVKDKQGRFTYPKRVGTGLSRESRGAISQEKVHLKSDSYDFIKDLEGFIFDR